MLGETAWLFNSDTKPTMLESFDHADLYTWLYNNTRGSLLLVTLFHALGNTCGVFLPVKFAVTGGILYNMETVFVFIAAVIVTLVAGASNLSRTEEKQMQEY